MKYYKRQLYPFSCSAIFLPLLPIPSCPSRAPFSNTPLSISFAPPSEVCLSYESLLLCFHSGDLCDHVGSSLFPALLPLCFQSFPFLTLFNRSLRNLTSDRRAPILLWICASRPLALPCPSTSTLVACAILSFRRVCFPLLLCLPTWVMGFAGQYPPAHSCLCSLTYPSFDSHRHPYSVSTLLSPS